MTIALGLLASDGVVLAADTQMGITDYLKSEQGKIAYGGRQLADGTNVTAIAIAGAGNVAYIEHVQRDFVSDYLNTTPAVTVHEVEERYQGKLKQFFRDHIEPFSLYPSNERPDLGLILAVKSGAIYRLWATEKNLMTEHHTCTAVGIGAMYAKILLNQYFGTMTSLGAMLLASYIVFRVKDIIDGCGKRTDVVALHRRGIGILTDDKIRRLEDLFDEYSKLEAELLHHILYDQVSSIKMKPSGSIKTQISKLRRKIEHLVVPTNVPTPRPSRRDRKSQRPSQE